VLLCTPEYAAALPGSFKNLLDWTVGGGEIYGKPVAWINVSTGAEDAHTSLEKVLGRVGADIVHHVCQRIPVTRSMVGADGLIPGAETRSLLSTLLDALVRHATTDQDDHFGEPS
jgi:NAD(P)H-dependent FMN reductase